MADKKRRSEGAIMADVLRGVAEAISYTEEEIRDTLSPEEAEEFIQERQILMESFKKYREEVNKKKNKMSLAAEDPAEYKK